ncbi:hypothetical protein LTR53_000387 [Teratosphaeriaceae sp. CCFEE 6253]|nr:hypothetical protein LTR53_005837 [Teratosphaeriaceae sp. CCFEE 6253]KAK3117837.1 hypothetical protein LTR53_000387 [Teratosphaeriaceae sp. CCFEE 6253]
MLSKRMLSREEEAQIGEEKEVRREDQEKINRFSRLHSREKGLDERLKAKEVGVPSSFEPPLARSNSIHQKEKEDLEEISSELELADEDDKVPYKIGDSFFSLPVSDVQGLLSSNVDKINNNVVALEEKLTELREEMQELKAALYGRFGRSINLEA